MDQAENHRRARAVQPHSTTRPAAAYTRANNAVVTWGLGEMVTGVRCSSPSASAVAGQPASEPLLGRVAQVNAVTCGMVRVCHVMRCSPRISGLG